MKKIIFLFLFSSFFCFSKVFIKEEIEINSEEEEIFLVGDNIKLRGFFKNDVIVLGKDVNGNFKVAGDFLSCCFNQVISAGIEKDLYTVGSKIFFEGKVKDSFTCLARNILIKNSVIEGNLRVIANKIDATNINVSQKSFFYGEKVKISGVFSDVVIHAKEIEIEKGTQIYGDLIYYSPQEVFFQDIELKGKIFYKKPHGEKLLEKIYFFKKIKFFYSFLSLGFMYFLLLIFAPNLFKSTVYTSGRNFIKSFFLGLFLIFIFSSFILLSFIIIIGVPVGLIAISVFLSTLYLSRGFIFIYLARKIFFKFEDKKFIWVVSILTGILIFNLLSLNSTLKIIINLIAIPSGFGALFIDRVKLLKKLREEKFF
ncbi:MAG: hypothetical protein NC915_01485 [Candidatus Omnitrophica bacterium]|nr:hypothetical protein [Candidatus Omnitrophota bacterium]